MMKFPVSRNRLRAVSICLLGGLFMPSAFSGENTDPAEVQIGERLFLETRFAQHYAVSPDKADPVMDTTVTPAANLPGPFKGKTMNCRACHMVDEHAGKQPGGMRSYTDFAARSPISHRPDGKTLTPRNSMTLVNVGNNPVLHHDGEFATTVDLVKGTLTGRNYGWLAVEQQDAIKHIARIIREDKGDDELGEEFGGAYKRVLAGTDENLPKSLLLPASYRVDVSSASDEQILDVVARLLAAYVNSLEFEKDDQGQYIASPYDQFLMYNKLPRKPAEDQSDTQYSGHLLKQVNNLKSPAYVSQNKKNKFKSHKQTFTFGAKELRGMQIFFNRNKGNCIACHAAPHFTDMNFHNTGHSQARYDAVHGAGSFAALKIPALNVRNKQYNKYLPATAQHPQANGRYRSMTTQQKPGYTDLGLWNVFSNPDMPGPQSSLKKLLCMNSEPDACHDERLLDKTIASFRTPSLRDPGHSQPYMHDGELASLEAVVSHYLVISELARQKKVRNADPELLKINLEATDIADLVAFLKTLNEDYE